MENDQDPDFESILIETVTLSVTEAAPTDETSSKNVDRPLKVDPNSYDPLTIARMTDHNVRGHVGSTASQIEQDDRFREFRKK
jgi:hypothetical protein